MKQVAGRLKRSEAWLSNLLNLVMLPTPIQDERGEREDCRSRQPWN